MSINKTLKQIRNNQTKFKIYNSIDWKKENKSENPFVETWRIHIEKNTDLDEWHHANQLEKKWMFVLNYLSASSRIGSFIKHAKILIAIFHWFLFWKSISSTEIDPWFWVLMNYCAFNIKIEFQQSLNYWKCWFFEDDYDFIHSAI